jgi:hypothetical protein
LRDLSPSDPHHESIELDLVHLFLGARRVGTLHERHKAVEPLPHPLLLGARPHDLAGGKARAKEERCTKLAEEALAIDFGCKQ